MIINTVVVHLPDPDKGHNPAVVSHPQLWAWLGEDSGSGLSRSG